MDDKMYEKSLRVMPVLRAVCNGDLLTEHEIQEKFSVINNVKTYYLGIDIIDNEIRKVNSYIGSEESSKKIIENGLINRFEQNTVIRDVINDEGVHYAEKSYSLLRENTGDLERNVIMFHLGNNRGNKTAENINRFIQYIGREKIVHEIENYACEIIRVNKSKKYPIFIIGIDNVNNEQDIKKIKIYYDIYQFSQYNSEWGENDYKKSVATVKQLIEMSGNKLLKQYSEEIFNILNQIEVDITLWGVNYNNDGTKDYKIYFRCEEKNVEKRIEFISQLHYLFYQKDIDTEKKWLIQEIENKGFDPAEVAIAVNEKGIGIKIYSYVSSEVKD